MLLKKLSTNVTEKVIHKRDLKIDPQLLVKIDPQLLLKK